MIGAPLHERNCPRAMCKCTSDRDRTMLKRIDLVRLDERGLVGLAGDREGEARAIVDLCVAFFPRLLRWTFPIGDRVAGRWLQCNETPYRHEIDAIARRLSFSGTHLMNTAYEWGCTSAVVKDNADGAPKIIRTLDWPFSGLGRYTIVVRQSGSAGPFLHVTWPGASGVLTGVACGRFAASLNMGPLRRRTAGELLRFIDYGVNATETYFTCRSMPPTHLLRLAFEQAGCFDDAVSLLTQTPVARPVIFTVGGMRPDDAVIIERMPAEATIRRDVPATANDWVPPRRGWEGRSMSNGDGADDCRNRMRALAANDGKTEPFGWLSPPVRNGLTRLAVEAEPVSGVLRVRGYEPVGDGDTVAAVSEGTFAW